MSPGFRVLLFSGAALFALACSDPTVGAVSNSGGMPASESAVADAPLAPAQGELLALAFGAASALPVHPHLKNRSREQEAVVETWLALGQPRRALAGLEQIDGWRRGAAYADLAFWCAQHGATAEVQRYLDLALEVAARTEGEDSQDWQRDRIRAGVARTYVWLGQPELAGPLQAGAADSEMGRVDAARAARADAAACDAQLAAVRQIAASGGFDELRNALESCARLFDRFYADTDRRTRIEETIRGSWSKLPTQVRIELLIEMSGIALAHADQATALALVRDAALLLDNAQWTPDVRIAFMSRLAGLRHRAGDGAQARREADAALALFAAERERIVDIDRADTLRPLAEAYQAMGDTQAALSVYAQALDEGVQNPNSRPRAEDLSATCCSMALAGVEPDARLWAKLRQVRDGLGEPW